MERHLCAGQTHRTALMVEDGAGETRSFPATRWSLVVRAGGGSEQEAARQALGELLTQYLPAMRAHLLASRWVRGHEVDDLLQGFIAHRIVEKNLVEAAEPSRGKFRAFLVTSLDHYVKNVIRDRAAAKRSPGVMRSFSESAHIEPADTPAVDPFDLVWGQEVIREALRRMQVDCEMSGRNDLWALFEARVAKPLLDGAEPTAYEVLVKQLRLDSPVAASNALVTAKRTFARMLRAVVSKYASSDEEIDEEIADLRRILRQARL